MQYSGDDDDDDDCGGSNCSGSECDKYVLTNVSPDHDKHRSNSYDIILAFMINTQ